MKPFREWFRQDIDDTTLYVSYIGTCECMLTLYFSIGTTENGWTTDQACFEWFNHCFLPQAKARNTSGKLIALLMDGHDSHVTRKLREHAEANGVHIYTFPSHTTHKLQPLDIGVFRPLQRAWQARCVEVLQERNVEVTQREFLREYLGVCNKVFTPNLIQKAFERSGIHPLKPDIFTAEDFAPSQITSHKVHVPLSYLEPHLQDETDNGNGGDRWGSGWDDSDEDEEEGDAYNLACEDDTGSIGTSDVEYNNESTEDNWGGRKGEDEMDGDTAADEPPTTASNDVGTQHFELSNEVSSNTPLTLISQTTRIPHITPRPHGDPPIIPTSTKGLQARINELEADNELLHTHATMAYKEIGQLQNRINVKKNKKKGKGRVTIATSEGRWWTVGKGRELASEKDAEDDVEHAKCGSQQWQTTQVYFYILYRYSTTLPLVVG
jgi:hypothetical protein